MKRNEENSSEHEKLFKRFFQKVPAKQAASFFSLVFGFWWWCFYLFACLLFFVCLFVCCFDCGCLLCLSYGNGMQRIRQMGGGGEGGVGESGGRQTDRQTNRQR